MNVNADGILFAKSDSNLHPTIHIGNNGNSSVSIDNARAFDIRNDSPTGKAIVGSSGTTTKFSVRNSGISVWNTGTTPYDINSLVATWQTTNTPINAPGTTTVKTIPYLAVLGNGAVSGTMQDEFKLNRYGRLYYENPYPFVTIDQKPPTNEVDLKARMDLCEHNRTNSMTEVHDLDTTVSGTAYMPSIIYTDKIFPIQKAKVNLYVKKADGSIATDAKGKITEAPIGSAKTDLNGNYSIPISELPSGTQLVAQAVIEDDNNARTRPANVGESSDTLWNKKHPLLVEADGTTYSSSSEETPVKVYKYTSEEGKVGLKISGKSEKRINQYSELANPATVNVYKMNGTLIGSAPMSPINGLGENKYTVEINTVETAGLVSGEKIYITITDDKAPVDTVVPHSTDKAYGIVKSIQPTVEMEKSTANENGKSAYSVGDIIEYTIKVKNTKKDSVWTNVTISDDLSSDVRLVPGSIVVNGATVGDDLSAIPLGDMSTLGLLAGRSEATSTFKAEIKDSAYGKSFGNTANSTGKSFDENDVVVDSKGTVTSSEIYVFKDNVQPHLIKSVKNITEPSHGNDKNYVGDKLEYTITIANNQSHASLWGNVFLSDELPPGVTFVPGSIAIDGLISGSEATYDSASRKIEVKIGGLKNLESRKISFEVTVDNKAAGTTITNVALANGSDENNTHIAINSQDKGMDIQMVPVVPSLVKTVANETSTDGKHKIGDILKYTVIVSNQATEKSAWTDVLITDTLPANVTLDESSITIDGHSAGNKAIFAGGVLTVDLGDIGKGVSKTITFKTTLNSEAAGTTVANIAKAIGEDIDNDRTPEAEGTDGGIEV